jgi:DNA-binding NtrC family response regulator
MSPLSISRSTRFILCVDDSESQLWLRTRVLEKEGFSVLSATTAEKALHLLRNNPVSVIVSDHMLSGTTGTELAAQCKKMKPNVPVVLYSGAPPALMGDVDCFILKGEPISEFLAIIRDLAKRFTA